LGGRDSEAYGINDAGQVVGWADTRPSYPFISHAFITGSNGMGMTDLGTLGGDYSFAFGINDAGQVVGSSNTAVGFELHAFITGPNGASMTDLGTLGGLNNSSALGINDAGQVVGESWSTTAVGAETTLGAERAFITGPNNVGMTDLNSLVSLPVGIVLTDATGINNHGQIIALGSIPLIPEAEAYAMFMAGLGLLGFIARRRKTV
jgi:probable HAF family extracellular repeat protein